MKGQKHFMFYQTSFQIWGKYAAYTQVKINTVFTSY